MFVPTCVIYKKHLQNKNVKNNSQIITYLYNVVPYLGIFNYNLASSLNP